MTGTRIQESIESPVAVATSGLDPFDRMLLTADGTVTTLVEACTGEPITTRTTRQAGPATIGRLLAAGSYETRREMLQITATRAGAASDHLGVRPNATLARRTYRIVIGRQAAVLVSEWISPGRLTSTALAPYRRTYHRS